MNSLVNIIKGAIHDNENIQKVKCRSVMKRIKQLVKKSDLKNLLLCQKTVFTTFQNLYHLRIQLSLNLCLVLAPGPHADTNQFL